MKRLARLVTCLGLVAGCSPGGGAAPTASPTVAGVPPTAEAGATQAATPATEPTSAAPGLAELPPFAQATIRLVAPGGEPAHEMAVHVADDAATRARGLMGVEDLEEGGGMVFLRPDDVSCCFTMENTLIPLSIAFTDPTGEVLAVLDMAPCDETPCPLYDPGVTYRHALEVNEGFFDEIGLEPGWRLELPAGLTEAAS